MTWTRAKAGTAVRRAVRRACAALAGAAILLMPAGAASAASTPTPASTAAPAGTPPPARTVMILLDINNSKDWVTDARQLALEYISALPRNVYAGLMTFAGQSRLVLPTTNRAPLEAAVSAVSAVQGAGGHSNSDALYSALARVTSAVPRLQTAGSRLVVISCAEDLKPRAFTASIPTDVIAQRTDGDDRIGELFPLASHSHGLLALSWSPRNLISPQRLAALVTAAFGSALPLPLHPTSQPQPPPTHPVTGAAVSSGGTSGQTWPLFAGIAALFAALVLIGLTALGSVVRVSEDREITGRIGHYGPQHQPAPEATAEEPAEDTGKVSRTAQDMTKRLMTAGAQDRLAERLDLAGIARKPAEWALLGLCLGVVVAATLSLVTSYVLIGVLIGSLVGWLTMRMSLSMRIVKRRTAFGEQLPDTLQLIASALRAGFSLAQALDAVVREDTQPIAGEFSRAMAEVRLGGNLEDGMEAVADRMDSDDLRWTIMAIRVQQGVGGNLAEVLLTIAGTIRERAYLRRQVRALSSEGRLSAYILVTLPVLIGIWLFISAKQYMRPLYTTHAGQLALAVACLLIVLGALWMRKMIRIKI
jgi:Flp pilus assembly protein TadB